MRFPAQSTIVELLHSEKRLLLRFAGSSLGRSALTTAAILLIREFLAGVLGKEGGLAGTLAQSMGVTAALWCVAGLLLIAYVGSSFFHYDNQVVQQRMVKLLELGVMERVIRHILTLSVPFIDRQSEGDLIQAVRQDVSRLRIVVLSIARLFLEGALAIGLMGAALALSPSLTFWALLVLPATLLPLFAIARRTLARSHRVRRGGYVLFDVLLQILRGIRVIKTFRGEDEEARGAVAKARDYFDELIDMVRVRALATFVFESFAGLSVVIVVIVGGLRVMSGALDWPTLMAFLVAARALQNPLRTAITNYMRIYEEGAAVDRIAQLLAEEPEVSDVPTPLPFPERIRTIELEGAGFEHHGRSVLEGVSFSVRAGETIGIAGPSGAGKTTLLGLVARFYDPSRGVVRIDGCDLRDYRMAEVYEQLAIVTQEPFLFATTTQENIRCGRPEASDAEVEEAARAAEIHDEILAMDEGYETPIGPGSLSGGQAQRINVARAILKNAPILLLDEATSSLDSISETAVQRSIDRLMLGRTTFVVAHRLSTLRHADRILVLERGRVVGLGPHEELVTRCPLYRRMWETQQVRGGASPEREAPTPAEAVEREDLSLFEEDLDDGEFSL